MKFFKTLLLTLTATVALNAQPAYNEQILANTGGTAVAMDRGNAIISDVTTTTVHFKDLDYATMLWQDNSSITVDTNASFGQSVAISNDIAVVGAPSFYGELYVFNGTNNNNDGNVYKHDTNTSGSLWTPAVDFPQKVSDGASLVSVGTQYIYGAVPTNNGGQQGAFSRFDKETGIWTTLTDPNGTFGVGMDMAYDGKDSIYLMEGTYKTTGNTIVHSTQIWIYFISSDTWSILTNVPEGVDFGASIDFYRTSSTGDGYLAVLSGGLSSKLHTYHLVGDTWLTNTTSSFPVEVGSDAVLSNNHYLYSLVPDNTTTNQSEFRRMDIRQETANGSELWVSMTPLPEDVGDGASLAVSAEYIYAVVGGSSNRFYRYSIADGSWTDMAQFIIHQGAALTFSNHPEQVYVYTKQSDGSWSYDANISLEFPGIQDHFGYSVGVDGDAASANIIVGAPEAQNLAHTGDVYAYVWDGTAAQSITMTTVWGEVRALGKSVDIKGDYLIVGAPDGGTDLTDVDDSVGAAYTYVLRSDGIHWNAHPGTLSDWIKGTALNGKLGTHVAINSDGKVSLMAGSLDTTGSNSYIYTNSGGAWSESLSHPNYDGGAVDTDDDVYLIIQASGHVHFEVNADGTQTPLTFFQADTVAMESAELYKEQAIVNDPTNAGGQARAWDIPCGIKPTYLIANEWAMISVPCGDGTADIGTLFGDDMGGAGSGLLCITDDPAETCNWAMYEDGPNYTGKSADNVQLVNETDVMKLGQGYWIIADHDVTLKADENAVTTRTDGSQVNSGAIPNETIKMTYTHILPEGNTSSVQKVMVGNPYPRTFQWENLYYKNWKAGMLNAEPIYSATSIQYIEPYAYVYDTTQSGQPYRAITATTPGMDGEIAPYQAFWMNLKALDSANMLFIPFEK